MCVYWLLIIALYITADISQIHLWAKFIFCFYVTKIKWETVPYSDRFTHWKLFCWISNQVIFEKHLKKKSFILSFYVWLQAEQVIIRASAQRWSFQQKIVDGFQTLSIFAKRSVFNALQGSKTPLKLKNGFSLSFVSFTNWIRKSKNKYSKMDLFEKKVNVWKPLSIFSKSSILEHLPLYSRIQFVNRQKMTWRNPFF